MSALTVNLPDNLHAKACEVAVAKNLSLDALVTVALAQSLSRLVAEPLLEERAARSTGRGLAEFLAQAPATAPPNRDRLPEDCQPVGYPLKPNGLPSAYKKSDFLVLAK